MRSKPSASNGNNYNMNSTEAAWKNATVATLEERRKMKKVALPEHAYTGYIPQSMEEELAPLPIKRNPPILGYKGHLRNEQDRIGMTFTKGLEVSRGPSLPHQTREEYHPKKITADKPQQPHPQSRHVQFQDSPRHARAQISTRSGYGAFDGASGYGEFLAYLHNERNDRKIRSEGSGYGAFDGASGYGEFKAAPEHTAGSGYGEFDKTSGYGEFMTPPKCSGGGSGYGAFDGASGYGEFLCAPRNDGGFEYRTYNGASGYGEVLTPPKSVAGGSGYGAFDGASGYGEFMAAPDRTKGDMSPRSGYGPFDGANEYNEFLDVPNNEHTSPGSGYGAFENESGYGEFAAPPKGMSERSGYGAFDKASGYGQFMHPPSNQDQDQYHQPTNRVRGPANAAPMLNKCSEILDKRYRRAIEMVGGERNALRLWDSAARTILQRHTKRTELLQSVKRSFEKREPENGGQMTKDHLKEALQALACVFTDDQVTALFGVYDTECKGTVPMDTLLMTLTNRL